MPTGSHARPRAAVVGFLLALVVFVGLQAIPTPGALVLPFTGLQARAPLGVVVIILVGVILAFSLLLGSATRARGGLAALIVLLGWIGGLAVHEQLILHGIDFNNALIGIAFDLALALVLSLAWLIAVAPPRRAWFALLPLLLIPALGVPAELLIRAVQKLFGTPTDITGQYAIVEFITTSRLVLLVAIPFALVVIVTRRLSRPAVVASSEIE